MYELSTSNFEPTLKKLKELNLNEIANQSITSSMLVLEGDVKENLSGKLVNVRTGRLRSSFKVKKTMDGDVIVWVLGSNVSYARFVEEGGSKLQKVKEHARKTKKGSTSVRSHARNVNRKGKFYLKTALIGFKEKMIIRLNNAIRSRLK